ncbi:hypothetical protein RGP44_002917 [Serratia marcescens]|uniref:hypothetical protein n=1 Tax=Serratia marcescens TaxID=615 RepID=UPI000447AB99|nr:hypothetical protein [Serratia marcescens]ELN4405975.1 hypothetical protein [Serratia marcescens]ETX38527.1 hypothetical protein P805_04387 [Serratia marcescens BIDMC 44]HBC0576099.1 hypothetical protein [Serratia marcescens]HBV3812567.1 hypothetical protein [Serratia marcescens]
MTTIKRFNPDYIMHAARFEPFARETEHGEFVRFEDHQQVVSALEAERDALAVENAALKDVFGPGEAVVNFLSIALRYTKYDCIDLPDEALAFNMSLPETPATDTALAAIQAQGVEKFADDLHKTAMATCSVKPDNTTPGAYAGMARSFAKKLREAK